MAKTRGAHSFRPRVHQGPTPAAAGLAAAGPSTGPATVGPPIAAAVRPTVAAASPAPTTGVAEDFSSVALAQRRYHTRVGPTPPAPSHPMPVQRAPPVKRAWTSGPGESSTLRSKAPPSPPYQGIVDSCHGRVIRNQQNLFPIFLLLP